MNARGMKTLKARGVVLREYEAGESDKRLTLLCKEYGRLTVYVRGARKPKSKFMAAAQLFTYGDFILGDGRQFYSMAQAEVIDSFYEIRADYDRLCYAHYAAEICEKTVLENTPCDDLLWLLLKTLRHLDQPATARFIMPPQQAACVFLFRFYLYYGLAPENDNCCVCGEEPSDGVFFCDEGIACRNCAGKMLYKTPLSAPALAALRYLLNAGVSEAFMFKASETVLRELSRAGKLFWNHHFQIKLQSAALIEAEK